jgi:hypothetical protein
MKSKWCVLFAVLCAALLIAEPAAAKSKENLARWDNLKQLYPTQPVWVQLKDGKLYKGLAEKLSDDALVIRLATGVQTFSRESIRRVQAKADPHAGRNAALAAPLGLVTYGAAPVIAAAISTGGMKDVYVAPAPPASATPKP